MIIAIRLLSSNEIIEVDVAFAVLLPVTRPRLQISSIAPSLLITTPVWATVVGMILNLDVVVIRVTAATVSGRVLAAISITIVVVTFIRSAVVPWGVPSKLRTNVLILYIPIVAALIAIINIVSLGATSGTARLKIAQWFAFAVRGHRLLLLSQSLHHNLSLHSKVEFYLLGASDRSTFQVADLFAFDTLHVSGLLLVEPSLGSLLTMELPHFQAAMVTMADHIALLADRNVLLVALAG